MARALMGSRVAGSTVTDVLNRGGTTEQAMVQGGLSALTEFLTEKLPFEKIGEAIRNNPQTWKDGAKALLLAMGSEGAEEIASEYANNLLDAAIMGDKSQMEGYIRGLEAAGYTKEAAEKMAAVEFWVKNPLMAGLGGALAGGVMSGAGMALNNAGYSRQQPGIEAQIRQTAAEAQRDAQSALQGVEAQVGTETQQRAQEGQREAQVEASPQEATRGRQSADLLGMSIETQREQKAQQRAKEMGLGEAGTRELAAAMKDGSVVTAQDERVYQIGYEMGAANRPREQIRLDGEVQERAYLAGRQDAMQAQNAARDGSAGVQGNAGGIVANAEATRFQAQNPQAYQAVQKVAQAMGVNVLIDPELTGSKFNGTYDGDGTIHISPDAENPAMVVLRHELTHHLKLAAPDAYFRYREFVVQALSDGTWTNGITAIERIRETYLKGSGGEINLDTEAGMDELAAHFAEAVLSDEAAMNRFIQELGKGEDSRSWGQKFFDWLREIAQKLRKAFLGGAAADKALQREIGVTAAQLEKAEALWKDAVRSAAAGNAQARSGAETVQGMGENQAAVRGTQAASMKKSAFPQNERSGKRITEGSIRAALYDALDHGDAGHDNLILLGRMPEYIRQLTGIDGDLHLYRNHAYENMVTLEQAQAEGRLGSKNSHFHGLGVETMVDAIQALEHPSVTYADRMTDGNPAISMVLPIFGKEGVPLHAVISFYEDTDINGSFEKRPHLAVTFYDHPYYLNAKERHLGLIESLKKAEQQGRILDIAKGMRADQPVMAKDFQSLGNIARTTLEKNIAQFQKEVKAFKEKNKIDYSLKGGGDVLREIGQQKAAGTDLLGTSIEMQKARRKLEQQKAKDAEKLKRLRNEKNAKIEEMRKQGQERTRDALQKVREDRDAKIAEVKEHYREKEAQGSERRKAAAAREKITRHVKELSEKLLRPTDKQLQEMQQKTLRALQWLGKNRHKAPEELKDAWDEALSLPAGKADAKFIAGKNLK